ncbi:hypothetical protein CMK14_03905 [Candidatus Poribacteria bacterium]|nr:hypothetical protein [Candidatus Poribacteria bacterium]
MSSDIGYNIFESENGDLWIGTAQGANRFTGVFEEHISASVNQGSLDAHTGDSVFSFFETASGQMWVRFFRNNRYELLSFDSQNWDTPKDLKTWTTWRYPIRSSLRPKLTTVCG